MSGFVTSTSETEPETENSHCPGSQSRNRVGEAFFADSVAFARHLNRVDFPVFFPPHTSTVPSNTEKRS